jgi:hypothetical protein
LSNLGQLELASDSGAKRPTTSLSQFRGCCHTVQYERYHRSFDCTGNAMWSSVPRGARYWNWKKYTLSKQFNVCVQSFSFIYLTKLVCTHIPSMSLHSLHTAYSDVNLHLLTVRLSKISNFFPPCMVPRSPQAHNPRSSRSCASMTEASGKRGEISNSKGTGRLHKRQR